MSKCQHSVQKLPYLAWHSDAIRRAKSGERQKRCPICLKWVWESLYRKAKP